MQRLFTGLVDFTIEKGPVELNQQGLYSGVPRGIRPLRHPHHAGSCVGSPTLADAAVLAAFLTFSQRSLRFESR